MLVSTAVLLIAARKAILTNRPTPLSLAIQFLYRECVPAAVSNRRASWYRSALSQEGCDDSSRV